MYSHGRGKISELMNRFLHEFLDTSNNSNSSFLQNNYNFTVGGITQKNYSIFHYGMEIGKIK
jgi:hypothetical protein